MRKSACLLVVALAMAILTSGVTAESFKVASFSDPSGGSANPLFTVDWPNSNGGTVAGGWNQAGLDLKFGGFLGGAVYENAWFQMGDLTITETTEVFGKTFGKTGAGQIDFYAEGTTTDPLLTINFDEAFVATFTLAADEDWEEDMWAENVTFSGSEIEGELQNQQFSFSFANVTALPNGDVQQDGFTATSSFTSSAIPEPATVGLLGLGGLALLRRRRF